jgi:biotin-dependent carboxylase-like uncharacterized protein
MLEVIEPGLLTTVQGSPRRDAMMLGVPMGGACDAWSLAIANSLLGNAAAAPALEMTLLGASLRARADCTVAVSGAEMEGRVDDGREVVSGSRVRLGAGQELRFSAARPGSGVRAYLAVAGGVDVPEVLGSASTCLPGGFGGLEGRPLRRGDVLAGRGPDSGLGDGPVPPRIKPLLGVELRVVRGPHVGGHLPEMALDGLLEASFSVGRGDRQGIRLEGRSLAVEASGTIVSLPMTWGAVQLPADGQPIVLLADHQTVGGYPVVAVTISADLPRLGQLGPGDDVRFVLVAPDAARRALLAQRAELRSMGPGW